MDKQDNTTAPEKLRVISLGIETFYEALLAQEAKAVQIQWRPPAKQSKEMQDLLDEFL